MKATTNLVRNLRIPALLAGTTCVVTSCAKPEAGSAGPELVEYQNSLVVFAFSAEEDAEPSRFTVKFGSVEASCDARLPGDTPITEASSPSCLQAIS